MWRRTAFIVAMGLSLASRSRLMGQEQRVPELLLSDLNWVRFDVIMGRIVAVKSRAKQDRQRAQREISEGGSESLTVSIDRGLTSLLYEYSAEQEELRVRVIRRDEMEVSWRRRQADGVEKLICFTQEPGRNVQLCVLGYDGAKHVVEAQSLWHLMVTEPAGPMLDFMKLLTSFQRDWQLLADWQAIQESLLQTRPWQVGTSLAEVRLLVEQLADDDFRIRSAADRELRARGRCVIGLLRELPVQELDAEQRMRVKQICRSLVDDQIDSPARVAAWLVNDKAVWLALLSHHDVQQRLNAAQQLSRIIEKPIEFDPAAVDAVRTEQLAQLRTHVRMR